MLLVETLLVAEVVEALAEKVLEDEDVPGARAIVVTVDQSEMKARLLTPVRFVNRFWTGLSHFGMGSLKNPWHLSSMNSLSLGRTSLRIVDSLKLTDSYWGSSVRIRVVKLAEYGPYL